MCLSPNPRYFPVRGTNNKDSLRLGERIPSPTLALQTTEGCAYPLSKIMDPLLARSSVTNNISVTFNQYGGTNAFQMNGGQLSNHLLNTNQIHQLNGGQHNLQTNVTEHSDRLTEQRRVPPSQCRLTGPRTDKRVPPTKKEEYDKYRKEGISNDAMVDLASVFKDYIGQHKKMAQGPKGKSKAQKNLEEMQKEREEKLIKSLKDRLQPYVLGQHDDFVKWAKTEAQKLLSKAASGEAMLHTIGYIYVRMAAKMLGGNGSKDGGDVSHGVAHNVGHVCRAVLRDSSVPKEVLKLRAMALMELGTIFKGAKLA